MLIRRGWQMDANGRWSQVRNDFLETSRSVAGLTVTFVGGYGRDGIGDG